MTTSSNLTPTETVGEIEIPQSFEIPGAEGEIDLDALALPQNFADLAAVKAETVAIPICRPGKQIWFTTHCDQKHWLSFAIIEDASDRGINHVLSPGLTAALEGEWSAKILVPCQTSQGTIFLWPIRPPGSDGKLDPWNRSALQIATSSGNQWIRIKSNREAQSYEVIKPVSPPAPPVWPEDIRAVIMKAVSAVLIRDNNHPLLKRLRGESR